MEGRREGNDREQEWRGGAYGEPVEDPVLLEAVLRRDRLVDVVVHLLHRPHRVLLHVVIARVLLLDVLHAQEHEDI